MGLILGRDYLCSEEFLHLGTFSFWKARLIFLGEGGKGAGGVFSEILRYNFDVIYIME